MTPLLKGLFKAKVQLQFGEDLHQLEHQTTTATNDQHLMLNVFFVFPMQNILFGG
jgi:hypothetical protein